MDLPWSESMPCKSHVKIHWSQVAFTCCKQDFKWSTSPAGTFHHNGQRLFVLIRRNGGWHISTYVCMRYSLHGSMNDTYRVQSFRHASQTVPIDAPFLGKYLATLCWKRRLVYFAVHHQSAMGLISVSHSALPETEKRLRRPRHIWDRLHSYGFDDPSKLKEWFVVMDIVFDPTQLFTNVYLQMKGQATSADVFLKTIITHRLRFTPWAFREDILACNRSEKLSDVVGKGIVKIVPPSLAARFQLKKAMVYSVSFFYECLSCKHVFR